MKRRLLNLLTAGSMLILVALCVLWFRSYHRADQIYWTGAHRSGVVQPGERWIGVGWGRGVLAASVWWPEPGQGAEPGRWRVYSEDDPRRGFSYHRQFLRRRGTPETLWRMGFGVWGTDFFDRGGAFLFGSRSFGVPFWCAGLAFAVAPAARLGRRMRARSRAAAGRCPACGYDLTANVSGVCPECGAAAGNAGAA
jgi:hypothetical protein